jgi:hypothetical protein
VLAIVRLERGLEIWRGSSDGSRFLTRDDGLSCDARYVMAWMRAMSAPLIVREAATRTA